MKALARHASTSMEPRCLRLIWQNPSTRLFSEVGFLEELGTGTYTFRYAETLPSEFIPLTEFPNTEQHYVSRQLPAFFANRVMSTHRQSYDDYLSWLGLDVTMPMEILARTGGSRVTDTFHVVDSFHDGCGMFFASGLSYIPDAERLLQDLETGQELLLCDEPDNPINKMAIQLVREKSAQLGWVPDWLVHDIHDWREYGSQVQVFVSQVNSIAPNHLKLLCQLKVSPIPGK